MRKKKLEKLIAKAVKIQAKLEACKPLYKQLDELTHQIASEVQKQKKNGGPVEVFRHGPYAVELIDNFSEKNTVFRATAVRRYELAFSLVPDGKG